MRNLFSCLACFLCLWGNVLVLDAKPVSVPVFVSSDIGIYEDALAGMQTVVNFETEVFYVEILQAEEANLSAWFQDLARSNPPMVISVGVKATRVVHEYLPDTTVLFTMVATPRNLGLEPRRMCGVSMDISADHFFRVLKEIAPAARKVAGFYTEAGKTAALEGTYLDFQNNLYYRAYPVSDIAEFESVLKSKAKGMDAILMTSDALYNRINFRKLTEFGQKNKVIIMTGFSSLVKLGATFGLSPDYARIGIQTGEMANRIYSGKSNCSRELVQLPEHHSLFLNPEYAQRQGITFPDDILARARLTSLFSVGITLLKDEKLQPARSIFEKILDRDPENRAASVYLDLVIEKQTGHETGILLKEAEAFMSQNRYRAARGKYAAVLRLNPKNNTARSGIARASSLESEEYRRQGAAQAATEPFAAIRSYLSALRVQRSNRKAASELAALRARESRNLSKYLNEGLAFYNRRAYGKAIAQFENVLLLQPGNQNAAEYLRLSRQKKSAADRLLKKQHSGG